jgi:CRISPR-associated endonuclease Cas1
MHAHPRPDSRPESIAPRQGIVTLTGYGLRVAIEHGRLALSDGLGGERRVARLSKATCGLKRLVILGHSGTVSLEALRWLHDVNAGVVQIDADGRLVLAWAPLAERPTALRRAQALAAGGEIGNGIVRWLLSEKVSGQAEVAERAGKADATRVIEGLANELGAATDLGTVAHFESQAARAYWDALAETPVEFARRDERKVPEHWKSLGSRKSPLTGSPRSAANPANAILNYLYAILEAETRIAVLTVGLDPSLGLMHTDQANRDSLALDVMEAVRPKVDSWLLDFLATSHFAKQDFFERADGTVRLTSRIASGLAEKTARALLTGKGQLRGMRIRKGVLPTPLTQGNRSVGRAKYRTNPRRDLSTKSPAPDTLRLCRECGSRLPKGRRIFCSPECSAAYDRDVHAPKFAASGMKVLARLRLDGSDPSHGGEVGRKRGASNARRAQERSTWKELGLDVDQEKERFKRDILPRLQDVPLSRIMKATGFSRRYASLARRGLYTPHPVHYEALAMIVAGRQAEP